MDSQHPCWLHSSFICKSYWRRILKGNTKRLETVRTIYGRLQQRSLFRQEDGADCAVKVEESCVVPTHSPELKDSIKTRKRQKILSKNPNSADALEEDTLNAVLQHTHRAKCCSFLGKQFSARTSKQSITLYRKHIWTELMYDSKTYCFQSRMEAGLVQDDGLKLPRNKGPRSPNSLISAPRKTSYPPGFSHKRVAIQQKTKRMTNMRQALSHAA